VRTFRLGRGKRGVYLVTNARRPMSEDIKYRQKRYLIMMGIRVVGLVLAVFLFHGFARFIAAGVAIVMPYFAVVFANGGREPDSGARFKPYDPERPQITGPSASGQSPSGWDRSSASDGPSSASDGPSSAWDPSSTRERDEGNEAAEAAEDGEPDTGNPRAEGDVRPGGKDSFSGGQGSMTAGEDAADPASQSRTRSNRA
jgi:hypothetical protein